MSSRDTHLLEFLGIARASSLRGAGLSIRDALRQARYRECRGALSEAELVPLLSAHPDLITDWLIFSDDKRCDGGWFVTEKAQVGEIRTSDVMRAYASIEEAIAAYVVRELDFWAT